MNHDDFLLIFQDILQRDDAIRLTDNLADLEEWDSLAIMACIAWFDKKAKLSLTFDTFKNMKTVGDVAALLPENIA